MKRTKWTRLIALCLAIFSVVSVAAATGNYDKNGDGKVDVWDLQRLLDDKEYEPEALVAALGGADELRPNADGVYEIWSTVGLNNMARHAKEGKTFKLMENIDMGGKEWTPISGFKGTFDGNGKTISNVKIVKTVGSNMGFFATTAKEDSNNFRTSIKNLHLDVQIIIDGTEDAVNENEGVRFVGGIVGENFGDIENCSTVCTVVDKRQLGDMKKTYYGTLVGNNAERTLEDGSKIPLGVIFCTNSLEHSLNITEESKKAVGKEYTVPYKKSETKVNSKMALFLADSVDYATKAAKTQVGIAGNTNGDGINKNLLWQDLTNRTELAATALQERRETAAAEMYELCTVEWKPTQDMYNYSNYTGGKWETETTILNEDTNGSTQYAGVQRGLPYAHSVTSMERFNALVGHYTGELEQWSNKAYYYNTADALALDGGHKDQDQTEWGLYIGSDCIAQVSSAWRRITAVDGATPGWAKLLVTGQSFPTALYMGWYNFKPVNDFVIELGDQNGDGRLTNADEVGSVKLHEILNDYDKNNRAHYLDSFAMVSKADALIGYSAAGNGHALLALSDAVVIRKYNGAVDANLSYIITAEQGGTGADSDGINRYSYTTSETYNLGSFNYTLTVHQWRSTCCVDRKYTFAALLKDADAAGATSWKYFPITCDALRNVDSPAAVATIDMDASGKVSSNFFIISTTVNGETVYCNMEQNGYRGHKVGVTLSSVHSNVAEGDAVTVQLSNGKTYTGVYGTAGLTEAN